MGSSVFVLRYNLEPTAFAENFLASSDFDLDNLKMIAKEIGVRATSKSKSELVTLIMRQLNGKFTEDVLHKIAEQLTVRTKEWISLKTGYVKKFPTAAPISELVFGQGAEKWYGPVTCPTEDSSVHWYIRPVFIDYWDVAENGEPRKFLARWLCFARVSSDAISLHWRGFTYPTGLDAISNGIRKIQFPYWNYVPTLFDEIEDMTNTDSHYAHLHNLTLHVLWDKYQDKISHKWTHRRIRAESNGVSLSAHAGAVDDLDVGGILHLARTVRKAVEDELRQEYTEYLPNPAHFDNVILRTLIREYGALSYEFSLEQGEQMLFRCHSYFGLKPNSHSADSFPHMQVFVSKRSALEQLYFLLRHINGHGDESNIEFTPIPLFKG